MKMTVETSALDRVIARAGRDVSGELLRALYTVANGVFNQSQDLVPFEEGHLQSSGQVTYKVGGDKAEVTISYGGAAALYAYDQHENMTYRHAEGRQAHYLSDPMERIAPMIDVILAGILSRELFP